MGFITVDDLGNKLYYEDTGPPSAGNSDNAYTTFIILHGTSFHSSKSMNSLVHIHIAND